MLGKAPTQRDLFSTESTYTSKINPTSFYRFLADHRHEIFRDADYAALYCHTNGRTSVPPSIVAAACVLQAYDRTSDAETVQRASFDVRWSVALGTELTAQPFAKSTLQEFRARLLLNDQARAIFHRSLDFARQSGYLKNKKMRLALDTTQILGKGAVKDTYNLVADGIKKLYRRLMHSGRRSLLDKFKEPFQRYVGKSFKGEVQIDWDDPGARQQLLSSLATDAKAILAAAHEAIATCTDDATLQKIRQDASLLASLLLQDVDIDASGKAQIKDGVAQDRIISTTDVEMRHGRKSARTRFDGHKAAVATDVESHLITAVEVIAGNAHDSEAAMTLVESSHADTGNEVEAVIGDCAFGTTELRETFENHPPELIAKAPQLRPTDHFTKHDFTIDLENNCITCPAGQTTSTYKWVSVRFGKEQKKRRAKQFSFAAATCAACPLRARCLKSPTADGKVIRLHPREDLLQQARADCRTDRFKERYRDRVVVEHSIARLVQRGIRQSRFVGRRRTLWQVAMAAAVVNLMVIAGKDRQKNDSRSSFLYFCVHCYTQIAQNIGSARPADQPRAILALIALFLARYVPPSKTGGFRPRL